MMYRSLSQSSLFVLSLTAAACAGGSASSSGYPSGGGYATASSTSSATSTSGGSYGGYAGQPMPQASPGASDSYRVASSDGERAPSRASEEPSSAPVTRSESSRRTAPTSPAGSAVAMNGAGAARPPSSVAGASVAGMVAPRDESVVTTTTTTTVAVTVPMQPVPVVVEQQTTAGMLTAATVGDHDRRGAFMEYLGRHSGERSMLGLDMTRRVRFRVVDGQGQGVHDAQITLNGSGAQIAGRSHSDGIWDFYPGLYGNQVGGAMTLSVRSSAGETQANVTVPFAGDGQDVTVRLPGSSQNSAPRTLDLGFMIDVTGSMGDELHYIHAELSHIVQRVQQNIPGIAVRVGATFYRDRTDPVVVQQIPFTTNIGGFVSMMGTIAASGGGDYPEDMNAGLSASLNNLQWTAQNAIRVLVLVADAPPQHYQDENFTYHSAIQHASAQGIRLLPIAASGADRSVEYLFRSMGAATSSPYVYLTDESGVGGPHMEADTDRVAVERFNDCLTRLIVADLRGQGMHELVRD